MVCLRNICINTLHKGDDDNNNNIISVTLRICARLNDPNFLLAKWIFYIEYRDSMTYIEYRDSMTYIEYLDSMTYI